MTEKQSGHACFTGTDSYKCHASRCDWQAQRSRLLNCTGLTDTVKHEQGEMHSNIICIRKKKKSVCVYQTSPDWFYIDPLPCYLVKLLTWERNADYREQSRECPDTHQPLCRFDVVQLHHLKVSSLGHHGVWRERDNMVTYIRQHLTLKIEMRQKGGLKMRERQSIRDFMIILKASYSWFGGKNRRSCKVLPIFIIKI